MANTRAKPELRTVTIAIVRQSAAAELIQNKLKSQGIESCLATEPSFALNKSKSKELDAVKVQVGRSDVQRALTILGTANLSASPSSSTKVTDRRVRTPRLRILMDGNPILPAIMVIFVIIAALILFLS